MDIEIRDNVLQLDIHGFGGIASNRDYAGTAFKLSGKMWDIVKSNNIKNKGKNIWVYESEHKVFAGVELENGPAAGGLESKRITLDRYAYFKHIGPYNRIRESGQAMVSELAKRGLEVTLPSIEIYGHWTGDESTSVAELLMALK
ncbi:MAG TPA: GyrI-like domain-containing protein [Bacteroidota bacterium]|nr:GyrI-like domain-containing protein [Bacteroidota bacterium]